MKYLLSQIAQITGGKLLGKDLEVDSVFTDSRAYDCSADMLFAAMKGINHDAHDFLEELFNRGVRAFMVEKQTTLSGEAGVVIVENTLQALQALASDWRQRNHGHVVAITGSNGKTTIKEWIWRCATQQGISIYRSPRSFNSQLGVALSLLRMPETSELSIIEAGISERGEMRKLEAMIKPQTVIFSSLGEAHQENFSSLEEKAEQKALLAMGAKNIIYHSYYTKLREVVEKKFSKKNLIDAASVECRENLSTAYLRNVQILKAFFSLMQWEAPNLKGISSLPMRLERRAGINGSTILDDTYSADLDSLSIALESLRDFPGKNRRVLILSNILQSGMTSLELYTRVAHMTSLAEVDLFIGIGREISLQKECFRGIAQTLFFDTLDEFLSKIPQIDISCSTILIKGNRTSKMERISRRLSLKSHTTILEVNLAAMERNVNYFRQRLHPSVRLTAMVKASSYGAGDEQVAMMLQKQGLAYLAVAFTDEGVRLRERGITMPILVLNADDMSFQEMIDYHLEPEIYSFRSLDAFCWEVEQHGEGSYPIHIKLDTGMHRLGFSQQEIGELLLRLNKRKTTVRVASAFTHLCVSDVRGEEEFTSLQIDRFKHMSSLLEQGLGYSVIKHAEASAAITRFPDSQFDMCRLGLGLYGFGWEHNDSLEPVSTLKTRIVQIHELEKGETVGYGREGKIERRSRIATIPIGYADGLNRRLGCGCWNMLVSGRKAPIIGRVCMDSCMIDVTDIEGVMEGDEVIIFSPQKGNTPEDMAHVIGTIPYEVLTSISKRVKRIYVND
ncbi:MAG: alanine racemase [Alistipes sp.]|nr:alanine racemase [Candidatus Alistipes equi]